MESVPRYIPQLRTALVLTGTGTAGAYHAGVLRALHEAGVKIDLVAGRGVGVVGAMFGAIDGAAQLWEVGGVWRSAGVGRLYRWRTSLRVACWMIVAAFVAVLLPVVVLAGAAMAYPVGYLLQFVGLDVGDAVALAYTRWIDVVFAPTALPTYVPRFVVVVMALLLALLTADAVSVPFRRGARRRARGGLWWRLIGTPLTLSVAVEWFADGLWQVMRGASSITTPAHHDLGERYAELLGDNVGQSGFRELLVLVHDVDARRDMVFALLADPHRHVYVEDRPDAGAGTRPLEVVDLTREPKRHAMDALGSALSVPVATEPHLVTYAPASAWRGETHRFCDRLDAIPRLLEEVAYAGVQQVILVSPFPSAPGPHTLTADRRDIRGRAGQYLLSLETAALHDAIASHRSHFQAIFHVRPTHNPLGPFDFEGCYDEHSDRRQTLTELVDRGYEDGMSQFVDAVVGASGELIDSPPAERPVDRGSISERLAAHDAGTPS